MIKRTQLVLLGGLLLATLLLTSCQKKDAATVDIPLGEGDSSSQIAPDGQSQPTIPPPTPLPIAMNDLSFSDFVKRYRKEAKKIPAIQVVADPPEGNPIVLAFRGFISVQQGKDGMAYVALVVPAQVVAERGNALSILFESAALAVMDAAKVNPGDTASNLLKNLSAWEADITDDLENHRAYTNTAATLSEQLKYDLTYKSEAYYLEIYPEGADVAAAREQAEIAAATWIDLYYKSIVQ